MCWHGGCAADDEQYHRLRRKLQRFILLFGLADQSSWAKACQAGHGRGLRVIKVCSAAGSLAAEPTKWTATLVVGVITREGHKWYVFPWNTRKFEGRQRQVQIMPALAAAITAEILLQR